MLLIGNDVVIQYTEDSLGYSGKITIQKGTYGDFFITSTVDNASLSEDDFAGSDLPAMVTDREELIKDDSLVETSIYIEYLDPDLYAE